MKTRYKVLLASGAIVAIVAIGFSIAVGWINRNLESLTAMELVEPKVASLPDGTYRGTYSVFPVSVVVDVEVVGSRIGVVRIVEHRHGRGEAAETLVDRVVETQSIGLSAVSGATYSSKVLLLAIQDALTF